MVKYLDILAVLLSTRVETRHGGGHIQPRAAFSLSNCIHCSRTGNVSHQRFGLSFKIFLLSNLSEGLSMVHRASNRFKPRIDSESHRFSYKPQHRITPEATVDKKQPVASLFRFMRIVKRVTGTVQCKNMIWRWMYIVGSQSAG